jgi:deoxyribose-phosphate aldolase
MDLTKETICAFIDHTNVKPDATEADIKKLCAEAVENNFHSVCVTPYRVKTAAKILNQGERILNQVQDDARASAQDDGKKIAIICVIGFPDGFTTTDEKINEAKTAVADGATEIDMVVNIGAIKDGNWEFVQDEISQIAKTIEPIGLKVILEVGYLTSQELIRGCKAAKEAGAAFVKTSTGYGPRPAKVEDIKIMREAVGPDFGVKASGGIHDFETACAMIEAGATRIGTSSGLQIIGAKEADKEKDLSKE